MSIELKELQALELWRRTVVAGIHRATPDFSQRQMAVLLSVYLTPPPHTVRGLAKSLHISKPAVTRALDRLAGHEFLRRKVDEADRRSVLIQRTVRGSIFLREFAEMIVESGRETGED
jgi:DNA-binding MarR family transcriptional regulator